MGFLCRQRVDCEEKMKIVSEIETTVYIDPNEFLKWLKARGAVPKEKDSVIADVVFFEQDIEILVKTRKEVTT